MQPVGGYANQYSPQQSYEQNEEYISTPELSQRAQTRLNDERKPFFTQDSFITNSMAKPTHPPKGTEKTSMLDNSTRYSYLYLSADTNLTASAECTNPTAASISDTSNMAELKDEEFISSKMAHTMRVISTTTVLKLKKENTSLISSPTLVASETTPLTVRPMKKAETTNLWDGI